MTYLVINTSDLKVMFHVTYTFVNGIQFMVLLLKILFTSYFMNNRDEIS